MDWLAVKVIGAIWVAMVATGFWEAAVEGEDAWNKGKLGWKIKWKRRVILTSYHFWLFLVMFPALLAIALIIDFSWNLFGIILSGYAAGLIIEDYMWFVANPKFKLSNFNPRDVKWHIWFRFGKFYIPYSYIVSFIIALASWFFIWK